MADSEFGEIKAMKYWTTDGDEDWFNVWWVNESKSSLQCRSNFSPQLQRYLDSVQEKGNDPATKRTACIGRREPMAGPGPAGSAVYETSVKVRFHSNDDSRCVPYAFLNAIQSQTKQKNVVMAAFSSGGWFGGLPDLARAVGKIGWHLSKIDPKAGDPEAEEPDPKAGSRPAGSWPGESLHGRTLVLPYSSATQFYRPHEPGQGFHQTSHRRRKRPL
jgi:hypothetical protein